MKPRDFLDPTLLISSGAVEPFHLTRWQRFVRVLRAMFNRS